MAIIRNLRDGLTSFDVKKFAPQEKLDPVIIPRAQNYPMSEARYRQIRLGERLPVIFYRLKKRTQGSSTVRRSVKHRCSIGLWFRQALVHRVEVDVRVDPSSVNPIQVREADIQEN